MKKFISVILIVLGWCVLLLEPSPGVAASESGTLTCAAQTVFTTPASFNSISLSALDVGAGVFIEPSGTASGTLSAVLLGRSILGQAQQVVIDGTVLRGAIAPDGRAYISGVATVGTLQGVPFSLVATTNSATLTVGSVVLPAATVKGGLISIE
ncbi:MAG TPA: hypothetical protein VIX17_07435 [Pyrinomonadaceae bacterium]|jgi:hypothetical protein